jgi:hypothetical protein
MDEDKPPMGPNSFGFAEQSAGDRATVQVMNDEAPGRIFREFHGVEIEGVTDTPLNLPSAGIDEDEPDQQRRWSEWTVIRKRSLP